MWKCVVCWTECTFLWYNLLIGAKTKYSGTAMMQLTVFFLPKICPLCVPDCVQNSLLINFSFISLVCLLWASSMKQLLIQPEHTVMACLLAAQSLVLYTSSPALRFHRVNSALFSFIPAYKIPCEMCSHVSFYCILLFYYYLFANWSKILFVNVLDV